MPPDSCKEADVGAWVARAHDLVELGGQAATLDPTLEPLLRESAPLGEYAWTLHYPGETASPTEDEAQSAFRLARRVLTAVLDRIPVHPKEQQEPVSVA